MESILYTVTVYTENQVVSSKPDIDYFRSPPSEYRKSFCFCFSNRRDTQIYHYDKQRSRYDTKSRTTNRKTH